jgi:hypothetical protein
MRHNKKPGKQRRRHDADNETQRIAWHPAFVEALQMELQAYRDVLEFKIEHQLTAEPLKIDCVVIKKAKNVVIKKNIAAIFFLMTMFFAFLMTTQSIFNGSAVN